MRILQRFNIWVISGAILVCTILLGLVGLVIWYINIPSTQSHDGSIVSVILYVTPSPIPTDTVTATRELDGKHQFNIGSYVQINRTDGLGLRIRSGPGTSSSQLFLGMDAEVFEITEGPIDADGFTWWYLVAPYDKNRSGWAASDYLDVITD